MEAESVSSDIQPQNGVEHLVPGAHSAADLLPLVYDELRQLAARRLAGESREHTLQPTALVHEVWVRLAGTGDRTWQDRQHFFATAAEAMRRILVDHARRRQAAKRGNHPGWPTLVRGSKSR